MKIKGFTLIELLVVISIIAILTTISISVFANLQKSGRDAKRKSDLAVIQSALEQYHADQHYYPAGLSSSITWTNPVSGVVKTYLATVPTDPLANNPSYCYIAKPDLPNPCSGSACTSYELYAKLERPVALFLGIQNAYAAPVGFGGPPVFVCDPSNYNLKVTPP